MTAFDKHRAKAWPHRYTATLHIDTICGGVPNSSKVAQGWLKAKLEASDDLIRQMVAETMAARGVEYDEAVEIVNREQNVNGFKADPEHGLYIEGRQVKAAIKEAANVAVAAGKIDGKKWGTTNKGLMGFVAEHVMVVEDRIYLGRMEPNGINQRFVHTFRGSGIALEEYVSDAKVTFTVITDWPFTEEFWAMVWLTGEQQGLGATRSQGFGRYTVETWAQS
jgi:hypothetical protein